MLTDALLIRILIVEGAMLTAATATLFIHALGLWMYRKRKEPRLALARATLAVTLEGEERTQLEPLSKLPRRLQFNLLTDIFPNISGKQRKRLSELSRQIGLTAWAEDRCRSRFWWRRLHGLRQLTLLGGGELVVPALLSDRHVNVRAQAAE